MRHGRGFNMSSVGNHSIEKRSDMVVKRFRGCDRGQHEREWRALTLLAEHAPGLAPTPVRADLNDTPPTIVMSRVHGMPLRGGRVRPEQITALANMVTKLQDAIPTRLLAQLPVVAWYQTAVVEEIRAWCAQPLAEGTAHAVVQAQEQGSRWLARSTLAMSSPPVFCNGDGNLSNYLWDGARVQIVDFEYSGRSDRAMALAEITEHVSAWIDTDFDVPYFLGHFELPPAEAARLLECRRLLAFELLHVLAQQEPGKPNPPGTVERQADRLMALLS